VICTATVEDRVPDVHAEQRHRLGDGRVRDAPRATNTRTQRETQRPSGRTQEIQRLIGRSLRAIVDTKFDGRAPDLYRLRRDPS
jgi:ribonuclease PH